MSGEWGGPHSQVGVQQAFIEILQQPASLASLPLRNLWPEVAAQVNHGQLSQPESCATWLAWCHQVAGDQGLGTASAPQPMPTVLSAHGEGSTALGDYLGRGRGSLGPRALATLSCTPAWPGFRTPSPRLLTGLPSALCSHTGRRLNASARGRAAALARPPLPPGARAAGAVTPRLRPDHLGVGPPSPRAWACARFTDKVTDTLALATPPGRPALRANPGRRRGPPGGGGRRRALPQRLRKRRLRGQIGLGVPGGGPRRGARPHATRPRPTRGKPSPPASTPVAGPARPESRASLLGPRWPRALLSAPGAGR